MLNLTETADYKIIKSIITDPILYKLTYGQGIKIEDFEVDTSYTYLLIKNEIEEIGCFMVKKVNSQVLEVHIFILPKYWRTGLAKEAVQLGHTWAKNQGYLHTYSTVPANCTHVLKFLQQINYKVCGMIEKGAIYNGYLVTLFLYNYEV